MYLALLLARLTKLRKLWKREVISVGNISLLGPVDDINLLGDNKILPWKYRYRLRIKVAIVLISISKKVSPDGNQALQKPFDDNIFQNIRVIF